MFSEGLAEYSALTIMEKRFGREAAQKFLRRELDGYLRGRGTERKTGDGRTYAIRETDAAGREDRVYRRAVSAERIPPRERDDRVASLRARLDSVPVPLD